MDIGDDAVDFCFVLDEEGLDVACVEEAGALGLGQDEVGEEEEAEGAVEGEPGEEWEVGFEEQEEREGGPVLEPGDEQRGTARAEGFVGEVDREEDGDDGAGFWLVGDGLWGFWGPYEMRLGRRSNMVVDLENKV